jgi:sugar phosphate isomerase/epimerase
MRDRRFFHGRAPDKFKEILFLGATWVKGAESNSRRVDPSFALSVTLSRMNGTSRRNFLGCCVGGVTAAWLLPELTHATSNAPSVQFPSDPRKRVSVAVYPFREFIVGGKGKAPAADRIELKNFAAHVVEKFNVHNIEPWSPAFPSTDAKYLEEFRGAVANAGSSIVDIAVDARHSQYSVNAEEREAAVTVSKQWIDVGVALASPSIRTHIHEAKDSKPDVDRAADTLSRVAEYAAKKNVVVHLENDDPVSEDPFFIVQVLDKVNSPWLRALPDFGNSVVAHEHDPDYAYRAIDAMFAHAYGICHVKDFEPNDQGVDVHVDLARTFAILKESGYRGYCSIEYDAPGDPYKPTAELVKKTIEFLS